MPKGPFSKKARISLLSILLILSVLLSVSCSSFKARFDSRKNEKAIADAIVILDEIDYKQLEESVTSSYLNMFYTLEDPEALSIEMPKPDLGEISYDDYLEDLEEAEAVLEKLDTIDPSILPEEYSILYDVLKYDMEEVLEFEDYYYFGSPFNSITGLQSNLPLTLVQMDFTDKESIEDYIAMINDVDRYYSDCMDFEKERAELGLTVADPYLNKLIESCQSMLEGQDEHFMRTSFEERLDAVDGLTDAEKQDYIDQHEAALTESFFPSYEMLIEGFTSLKGTSVNDGGICNFESGKEYYESYFQLRSGTDLTPEDAIEKIEENIDALYDEMYSLDISDEQFWDDYYATVFSKGTIQENVDYCIEYIADDFPELPNHDLILQQVPVQLEEFFSPAAYFTCRIDNPEKNVIITNESALEGETNLLDTVAHEGYPGHLFQNVYHASTVKNYYQRIASFTAFSEGWAEYSGEYVLNGTDYDTDMIKVTYLDAKLQKLLMARVDIGVNYEGWDKDDISDFLAEYGMDYPEFIDWTWDIAIEIPCYITPYCFGQLKTSEIIGNAVEKLGDDVPMIDIHTAYLKIGPAPFVIIEKYMDEFVNNT
jgi:uncharacterized protein (DUF885 family)